MSIHHPPHFYELAADAAKARGDFGFAIRALHSASAVSIGHNRSARYEEAAAYLAREHGLDDGGYLTDEEVAAEDVRQADEDAGS